MSEELLKFLLSELKTIRICCKGRRPDGTPCAAVIEFPVARLKGFFNEAPRCPFCQAEFVLRLAGGAHQDPFEDLAKALNALAGIQKQAEIEFVFPKAQEAERA
jgi:hypothetical protein